MTSPLNTARDPYAPTPDEQARQQRMKRAWDAYSGCFQGGNKQWPLLWKDGKEPNPNIIINRCGPAVDTDVSWLFGESVDISLPKPSDEASDEASGGAPKEAQQYVDKAWGVNSDDSSDDDKMSLLQELATNGAITGHAFLKIVWDSESTQEYPELVVLDSTCVRVKTDPHNIKVVTCYIVEYAMPDPASTDGAMGTFRQVIELQDPDGDVDDQTDTNTDASWLITDWFKGAKAQQFTKQDERKWPFPWAPIDGCPHIAAPNQYYGRPRITNDVIHVNEAICTVASNINKIGMRHGHPILYTIQPGNNQKSIRHEPGTILVTSSDVKAVEAHGDLEHLMKFEEDLRADFDEETHVPAQAFGRQHDIPRTPVSGVAIRLGYGPLLADVTKERRTYGALIRRVTQHIMELKNATWAKLSVTLGWQDPLPADDLQAAQVVQAARGMGVMSKETAAEKMGLDWEEEQANMANEDAAALTAFSRGQGMPPATDPLAMPPDDGSQPPAQPGQAPNGQMPPTNHPAAVAARNAMSSLAKGGQ